MKISDDLFEELYEILLLSYYKCYTDTVLHSKLNLKLKKQNPYYFVILYILLKKDKNIIDSL